VRVYFDTSVLVASSVQIHVHFHQAQSAVLAVHAKQVEGYTSAHALAEFYAVTTRTPFSSAPIYPHHAWQLLSENILSVFEIVALSKDDYHNALQRCIQSGWPGGRIYDALHIESAQKAQCERIYTFNVRHFQQLAPELSDQIEAP
jgi:predicted nucleic acid-binding protein